MQALTSTLADLTAAKLTDWLTQQLPAGPPPVVQPSTDPAVYRTDGYIKQLNLQAFNAYIYGSNDVYGGMRGANRTAVDRFNFAAKIWEQGGKSAPPPSWPAFQYVDTAAFDLWWATYSANPGQNAPDLFFIKNLPALPAVVILGADNATPPVPATDGPIGAAVPNNPGVFNSSGNDKYPDGYIYAGPTGVYQKHVYSNPFTAGNVRVIWVSLQPVA